MGGDFLIFSYSKGQLSAKEQLCVEKVRLGSPPSFYGREKLVVTRQSPHHEKPCLPKPKHIPCIHLGSRMRPLLCCTLWIHVRIAGMHKIKKSAFYNAFLFLLEKKVILSPVSLSLKMNCRQAAVLRSLPPLCFCLFHVHCWVLDAVFSALGITVVCWLEGGGQEEKQRKGRCYLCTFVCGACVGDENWHGRILTGGI